MTEFARTQIKAYMTHYLPVGVDVLQLDKSEHARLFELVAAYDERMVLWQCIPQKYFDHISEEYKRFLINGDVPQDYGIHALKLAEDDELKPSINPIEGSMQAKWAECESSVSWVETSSFAALCESFEIRDLTMAVSENVKFHALTPRKINTVTIPDSRIVEIITESMREVVISSLTPPPMRQWQINALELLNESIDSKLDTKINVVAQITCGAGKTRMIVELIRRWRNVVIFVPSTLLLHQFEHDINRWDVHRRIQKVGDGCNPTPGFVGITVCIYNSAFKLKLERYDLVVVDEAHHIYGKDNKFAFVIRRIKTRCTLLVSATLSAQFGEFDYEYQMYEAINDGIVVDYQIVVPIFDKSKNQGDGLRYLINKHPEWTRILAYCNKIIVAKQFTDECIKAGIKASTFDGSTPIDIRRKIIDQFERGEIRIITTVDTLGEGVDICSADTAMFVELRKSPTQLAQILGRVMRKSPGKTLATVILPSVDQNDSAVGEFMGRLAINDIRLVENWKKRSSLHSTSEITDKAAELCQTKFYSKVGNLSQCVAESWRNKYEQIVQFVIDNSRIPVHNTGDGSVGTYAVDFLSMRKGTKPGITTDLIIALDRIPGWDWGTVRIREWRDKYNKIKALLEGGLPFPDIKDPLGFWANAQRLAHEEPKFHAMIECQEKARSGLVGLKKREPPLEPPASLEHQKIFRQYKLI